LTYDLATVWKTNISYTKVVFIVVGVDGNLTPASGDLADICEEVDCCAHRAGRKEKSCGELWEKHLRRCTASIE
jgi:hypothetical protein